MEIEDMTNEQLDKEIKRMYKVIEHNTDYVELSQILHFTKLYVKRGMVPE